MTLTYTLSQDDYLNHQLFTASLSNRVKRQRKRSRIIWFIAFLSLAWLFYLKKDNFLAYYFFIFTILYILFYPYYSRWYYKRHYKRFVNETYKNRFGKISSVIINEEQIQDIDEGGETKILVSEIENIYETSEYFFLRLKSGLGLIIPKHKVDNVHLLKHELKTISNKQHIDFIEMQNWKWK
jgi:hypothetical protein